MTPRAFIVDTNVVVAGLLTANPASPVARVLDGMLVASFPFVVSQALLAEYHAVLTRPKLLRLHGLPVDDVETILTDLAQHAIVLVPTRAAAAAPDPGDQMLRDLLALRADLCLITGDRRLLADAGMSGRVVTAGDFVASPGG